MAEAVDVIPQHDSCGERGQWLRYARERKTMSVVMYGGPLPPEEWNKPVFVEVPALPVLTLGSDDAGLMRSIVETVATCDHRNAEDLYVEVQFARGRVEVALWDREAQRVLVPADEEAQACYGPTLGEALRALAVDVLARFEPQALRLASLRREVSRG